MAKRYQINQYPKYKEKDHSELSSEQLKLRVKSKKKVPKKSKRCNSCGLEQSIDEFYFRDKKKGTRKNKCRDCQIRDAGVVEVGKRRFSLALGDKGFRKCFNCKDIKPLSEFPKSKKLHLGHSYTCKGCSYIFHHEYVIKQRSEIGDHYVKQYALRTYNKKIDDSEISKYREEIIQKRQPKHFCDGLQFYSKNDFALHIESNYGHPITQTLKRLDKGYSEEDCKISESEIRSRAYTKGAILVTNTVTGKMWTFKNTKDPQLLKMFSVSAIVKGIKSGEKTRVTSLSKYKYPCLIRRIED